MTANWSNQTIWTGDNLEIMRGMNSESVDLIYLDPPFNSKANYAAPIGSQAAGAAFKDTWTLSDVDVEWINLIEAKHPALYRVLLTAMTASDKSYLSYMAARILEMRRILKPVGSIYLHCDPTMSHYLKLIMDAEFGRKAFQTEIAWKRTHAHGDRVFANVADRILFYGQRCKIKDECRVPLDDSYIKKQFRHRDNRGRYQAIALNGPKVSGGESGMPWRNVDPSLVGRCWSPPKTGRYAQWINDEVIPGYQSIAGVHDRLNALDEAGMIHWSPRTGNPRLKRYLRPNDGQLPSNVWTDIPPLSRASKEKTDYPTQKPLALLRRIIEASSNERDVVLDPFCGCATACIAAEIAHRQWVGIDIAPKAAELVKLRMEKELGMFYDGAHRTDIPRRTDLSRLPRYNGPANKRQLYGEQEGNCAGCVVHFEARNLEVDHIIARGKGGTDHIGNLQLLCGSCNRIKGDRGMEYLRAKLQL